MTTTVSTILAILIILLAISYPIIYWVKKKNNKPLQAGYKIIYGVIFLLLAILLIKSLI